MIRIDDFSDWVNGDKLLALFFFFIGLYLFVESYNFPREVAIFPRFVTVVIMIGSALILCRNFLPTPLKILVEDDRRDRSSIDEKLDIVDENRDEFEDSYQTNGHGDVNERIHLLSFSIDKGLFTGIMCLIYIIVSYLVGMHYATPLFAATYMYATKKPLHIIIIFGIIGYLISVVFIIFLEVDLMNGVILP